MSKAGNPLRPTVVDIGACGSPAEAAGALHDALTTHGFAALRNCGIDTGLRDAAFQEARQFFGQPDALKQQALYTDTAANFGFQPLHSEALDPAASADYKEAFTMRALGKPDAPAMAEWRASAFGSVATRLYKNFSDVALNLLTLMEQALGATPETFTQEHTGENMTLRYLHYPVLPQIETHTPTANHTTDERKSKKTAQLGAGAHTDYGTITLLFSDGVAGLQLRDHAGDWRDVEVTPGDALLNTGDLMALWSNGLYPSTLHRVQPRLVEPGRYSMAFFVDPDSQARIAPLAPCITQDRPAIGKAVLAGEHIQRRIDDSQRQLAAGD